MQHIVLDLEMNMIKGEKNNKKFLCKSEVIEIGGRSA